MVQKTPKPRRKRVKLAIPRKHHARLAYIDDALICLKQSGMLKWVTTSRHEDRVFPFFDLFEPDTQSTIDMIAARFKVSRSSVVATALEIHEKAPSVGAKPSGFRGGKMQSAESRQ